MKRSPLVAVLLAALLSPAFMQTIDKPVATLKLTKLEVISLLQFKTDVEKVQSLVGRTLTADERRQFLDSRVNSMLFFQYCDREKIYVTDSEVSAAIAQQKAQAGANIDDAKLDTYAMSQGFSDIKALVKFQLLFQRYIQAKRQDDVKSLKAPTSDDVLKAYDLMKSTLVRPDTVRVSVIFVDYRALSADAKAKARDALNQVASKLKADPSRFDEFVIKASDAGSLYKASPSVYVSRTQQFQDLYGGSFMDKVFKMKAGDVSDPIENEVGLQIVRLNEFLPQKQLALSDTIPGQQGTVQDYIMQQLMAQKQQKLLASIENDLVSDLRKQATVKIYTENLSF